MELIRQTWLSLLEHKLRSKKTGHRKILKILRLLFSDLLPSFLIFNPCLGISSLGLLPKFLAISSKPIGIVRIKAELNLQVASVIQTIYFFQSVFFILNTLYLGVSVDDGISPVNLIRNLSL